MPVESPSSVNPGAPAPAVDNNGARISAVDQATEAARTRINTSGSALPAAPHHSAEQPRVETGQFHKAAVKEVGAGIEIPDESVDPARKKAAPEGGQAAEEVGKPAAGGEGAPEGDRAADGQGEAEEDSDLIVALPPRNEGEEEVEIQVTDPQVAERLRQLKNSAMRGAEVRETLAQARRDREQVEEFEDMLAADPGGVVLGALADDPATLQHLALFLITRPEVWDKVKDQITQITADPEKFENARLRAQNDRNELKENFQTVAQERRAVQENYTQLQSAVALIMPPEMAEAQKGVFFADALRDIAAYAERTRQLTVTPTDVPLILAARMTANGIDPVKAAQRLAAGPAGKTRSSGNGAPNGKPADKGAAPSVRAPQRTGAEMVEGSKRRAVAARIPGGGAGTEAISLQKPTFDPSKGTSAIDQALEQHRARLEAGRSAAH